MVITGNMAQPSFNPSNNKTRDMVIGKSIIKAINPILMLFSLKSAEATHVNMAKAK